jgi:hypothetical protein
MKFFRRSLFLISFLLFVCLPSRAAGLDLGSDFVSSYIWRGQRVGGISIQPYMEYSYKGMTLGSWSSVDIQDRYNTELDFYLAYSFSGFTLTYTDYFFDWENKSYFGDWKNNHTGEISLEYDFQEKIPFRLQWTTYVFNDDNFSSYAGLTWFFKSGDIDCELTTGLTPWNGIYNDKFSIVNLEFKAIKNILIGNYELPVSGSLIFNPVKADLPKLTGQDGAFFVLGISI